jgi:hypothetical protein
MPRRRRFLNAVLALLVLWAALALAREVRHLQWRHAGGLWFDDEPCLWRYGTPPTDRLERFLEAARPAIDRAAGDEERTVYFRSGFEGGSEGGGPAAAFSPEDQDALCTHLWAVYLLPDATLRRAPRSGAPPEGSLWLAFRVPEEGFPSDGLPEGVEPLVSTEDGVLGVSAAGRLER